MVACRGLPRHAEHTAVSGCVTTKEHSSGSSLPRWAVFVTVLCQQHGDVEDVTWVTSSTACTVSYRSTKHAFCERVLTACFCRPRRCYRVPWPGSPGGTVLGVPGEAWYHGTPGTMVHLLWYPGDPCHQGTRGANPGYQPVTASVIQRLAAQKPPVLVTFWSLFRLFLASRQTKRRVFSSFSGKS